MDPEVKSEINRLHDEETRQNKRLEALESKADTLESLTLSVKELAINSRYTKEKVDNIDSRLDKIEKEPLESLSDIKGTTLRTFVAFVIGMLCTALFWLITNHGI